ncbi:MAG: hypothetical protein WAS07_01600 [Micropruina sp.]|nr:hypothetical protein [Micropruina sp.]
MTIPTYEEYVAGLTRITAYVDPMASTPETRAIREAAAQLAELPAVDPQSLTAWVAQHPASVPVLGLAVGLGQEKLKNALRQHLGSSSWKRLVRADPEAVVAMLDIEFELVRALSAQRRASYGFGDILVARAGTRVTATSATTAGRLLEDRVEAIADDLGLTYQARTRFQGRHSRTAPCDLAVPGGGAAASIVVAAKAFDSTGSKLTDAVREVEEMADVRRPTQFVFAVIDGIGWLSRANDLRKLYALWVSGQIDGMFTLSSIGSFAVELRRAAERLDLL